MIALSKCLEKDIGIRVPLIFHTYLLSVYVAETWGLMVGEDIFLTSMGLKTTVFWFCPQMISTLMTLPIMKKYGMPPSLQGFSKVSLS